MSYLPARAERARDDPEHLAELHQRFGSDQAVADHLGVSRSAVRDWVRGRGGAPARRHQRKAADAHRWPPTDAPEMERLVADHGSDAAVADACGVSESRVNELRNALGVSSPHRCGKAAEQILRDEDKLRRLLTEQGSDRAASIQLGVAEATVRYWRNKHDIDPINSQWGPADEDAAEVLRDSRALSALLAEHSTNDVGRLLGVSGHTVRYWRNKHRGG